MRRMEELEYDPKTKIMYFVYVQEYTTTNMRCVCTEIGSQYVKCVIKINKFE